MPRAELDVYLDLDGVPGPIGHAWFTRRGGTVTTVFAYSGDYLANSKALSIDPALELVSGNQYVAGLPGAFQDCAPDRWGRNLIDKRHRAGPSSRAAADLDEVDYLTQVADRSRQGAIRFTLPAHDIFLDPNDRIPKLIELPRLVQASEAVDTHADDLAAVKELLDAGSGSLGGARPKASVLDPNGGLLVAKFPHHSDMWDVMGWECVALDLAEQAGIETPSRNLVDVSDSRRVLLLDRFDRTDRGNRIPYISAMTALAATDGDWHDYIEIAEVITDIGADVTTDLGELYRRVTFGVAIHNTDDHLRNHGFLAARGGWRLAPLFDVNPNPNLGAGRVTGISGAIVIGEEKAGLRALAEECRLSADRAHQIRNEVTQAVSNWRAVAARRNIAKSEIEQFAPVFERT